MPRESKKYWNLVSDSVCTFLWQPVLAAKNNVKFFRVRCIKTDFGAWNILASKPKNQGMTKEDRTCQVKCASRPIMIIMKWTN